MRRLATTGLLVLVVACGGSSSSDDVEESDDASVTTTTTTTVDGDLFTERDGADEPEAPSEPGDDESAGPTSTSSDDDTDGATGGDDDGTAASTGGGAGADGDGTADDTSTDGSAEDGSADGGSTGTSTGGSADGGTTGGSSDDASDDGSTDGSGTDGSTGASDEGGTPGGDDDPGALTASDIDESVLLDAAELSALGLGDDWVVEVVIEPAGSAADAPCGLDRIAQVDQLYAPGTDAEGREFEQVVVPGAGPVGLEVVRGLADCAVLASQLGEGGVARNLDVAGRTAASFAVVDEEFDEALTWIGVDVDGVLVFVFHIGERAQGPALEAAVAQMVTDVAAAT